MRVLPFLKLSLFFTLAFAGAGYANVEPQDQALIRSAQAAIQVSHEQRMQLWKGFDFSTYPLILYTSQATGDHGLLFNYPTSQAPEGFRPVSGFSRVYDTVSSQAYPAPFDIGYPIGDYQGVVIDRDFSLLTVIHETFHFYQHSKAFFDENTTHNTSYEAEDVALAELEQAALANALQSNASQQSTAYIHRFLNLRNLRNALHPEEVTSNENSLEAIEGTAAYVEKRFSQLAFEAKLSSTTEEAYQSAAEIKKQILADLRAEIDKDAMKRGRYSTGFAMAQLLSGYSIDWQKQIESGQTLVDVLQAASRYPGVTTGFAEDVRQQPDFLKRKAAQQAYIETLNQAKERAIRNFESSKGTQITVRLPFAFGGVAISTRDEVNISENRSIVDQYASVSKEDTDLSLLIKGTMLQGIDPDAANYLFVFYANPIDVLKVEGQSVLSKTGTFQGALELRTGETRLQAKKAQVVMDEKGVQIQLLK